MLASYQFSFLQILTYGLSLVLMGLEFVFNGGGNPLFIILNFIERFNDMGVRKHNSEPEFCLEMIAIFRGCVLELKPNLFVGEFSPS